MPDPEFDDLPPEGRLKLWADALNSLATPDVSRQLIGALDEGDRGKFEELLGPTRLFQHGGCIDIVETLTKIVNFGRGKFEDRCTVIPRIRPLAPSHTHGSPYILSDRRVAFVTSATWWSYYDRALQDPDWLAHNRDFLRALGIIICTQEWVPDQTLVSIERTRTICFPDVIHPYDRDGED